jgi:hypothetical protein
MDSLRGGAVTDHDHAPKASRCADSTEFEHSVQGYSERPLRELPIIRSSNRDHRRSVATSRYFGDDSPPLEVEMPCSRILTVRLGSVGPPGLR